MNVVSDRDMIIFKLVESKAISSRKLGPIIGISAKTVRAIHKRVKETVENSD